MAERAREKRLTDADWPEHDDVTVVIDEAKARELGEQALVERDLKPRYRTLLLFAPESCISQPHAAQRTRLATR